MERLLKIDEVAQFFNKSKSTIYQNPKKYGMFKINSSLRAKKEDLELLIEESKRKRNNVIRLALVDNTTREEKQWHCLKGMKRGISISQHPAVSELSDLLGQKIRN